MKQIIWMTGVMVSLGIGGAGCMTDGEAAIDEEQTSENSAELTTNHVCWSTAGLYWSPCGGVRETMHYGETIDVRGLPQLQYCNFEYWTPVTHHATGHQGWIRSSALCF